MSETTTTGANRPAIPVRALYPLEEARELLGGIGKTLIANLVKQGKLRKAKLGDRSLITAESLNAYIRSLEMQ